MAQAGQRAAEAMEDPREEAGKEHEESEKKEGKPSGKHKDKAGEKLKKAEAERDDYLNALQRERADFENYKKRNATLAATSFQNGVADTVMAMLPILDNFERALTTDCTDEAFFNGMNMIMRQLQDALKNLGLEEIPADGAFDPEFHNAVMQVEEEGYETNHIVEVLQKGYLLNGKVLRHSMVKVAK